MTPQEEIARMICQLSIGQHAPAATVFLVNGLWVYFAREADAVIEHLQTGTDESEPFGLAVYEALRATGTVH